jgi:drug/metabolite transporter (DMT)-like permease
MYHLFGSILLKSIDPYFRRYLTSSSLNPTDYMYLETFIYTFVLILFISFKYFYNKKEAFESFKNLQDIKISDIIFMSITSFFFIYSTVIFYENEHKNNAFSDSVLLRGGTLIGILLVGIIFYKEKYNWKQIIGIIFTFIGICLLLLNK